MPIEQVAPELTRLVDLDAEVEWLGSGFGADATPYGLPWWPAEGPVQTLTLLLDDLVGPNGLCFSPSERILYINDSRSG